MATVYTVGHSNRSWEDFLAILKAHEIKTLIDIRRFPYSPKWPHFNGEAMRKALQQENVSYLWLEALGGRRNKLRNDSPNTALRSLSFRNYADYMLTEAFAEAAVEVVRRAEQARTAILCSEAVYFRCHRMLVSDWLVARGHEVLHLESLRAPRPHRMTDAARVRTGELTYPGETLF